MCLITVAFESILRARKTEERKGSTELNNAFIPLPTTCYSEKPHMEWPVLQ